MFKSDPTIYHAADNTIDKKFLSFALHTNPPHKKEPLLGILKRERSLAQRRLIKLSQKFKGIFRNIPDSRMKLSLGRG